MSIKYKFVLLLAAFVIATGIVIAIQFVASRDIASHIRDIDERLYPAHHLSGNLLHSFEQIDNYLELAVLTNEEVLIDNAYAERDTFLNLLAELSRSTPETESDVLRNIGVLFSRYFESAVDLTLALIDAERDALNADGATQNRHLDEKSQRAADDRIKLQNELETFTGERLELFQRELADISRESGEKTTQSMLLSVISVLIIAAILYAVSRSIVKPVLVLSEMTDEIAHGIYEDHPRLQNIGRDEIGHLATSFIKMSHSLKLTTISRDYFDRIIQSMADMLFVLDMDLNITMVNRATESELGYRENELIGSAIDTILERNIFSTDDLSGESGTAYLIDHVEVRVIRKDGGRIPVSLSSSLLTSAEKAGSRLVCVASDITAQKRAEEAERLAKTAALEKHRLQEDRMQAMSILVAGVAHEVNNPNHMIASNANFLTKAWESARPIFDDYAEQQGDFNLGGISYSKAKTTIPSAISIIQGGADRIRRIVEELRDFAREQPIERDQEIDINAVVTSATELMSKFIEKQTQHFRFIPGENLPAFMGNYQKLEQVVINLITNAGHSLESPDKGITVQTSLNEEGTSVILRISDEGIGIPEETLHRIMDPFFTTRRDTGGSGLGLSITSRILSAHGATITFESTPGKGTDVKVSFPLDLNDITENGNE